MFTPIKYFVALVLMLGLSPSIKSQNLTGAWKLIRQNGNPFTEGECIKIFSESYFMFGHYGADGAFIKAGGGNYSIEGKNFNEMLDFYTADSSRVRKPVRYSFVQKKDELLVEANINGVTLKETWKRVDDSKSELKGCWKFGARVDDDGKAGERRMTGPRQTIKILSGKRFQWAAFNYETKQFMGSGGGEYSLKDNLYTETIQFFSRDNTKVGISLSFACTLEGTDWYHKGKGTTGNPVSEVWERIR